MQILFKSFFWLFCTSIKSTSTYWYENIHKIYQHFPWHYEMSSSKFNQYIKRCIYFFHRFSIAIPNDIKSFVNCCTSSHYTNKCTKSLHSVLPTGYLFESVLPILNSFSFVNNPLWKFFKSSPTTSGGLLTLLDIIHLLSSTLVSSICNFHFQYSFEL